MNRPGVIWAILVGCALLIMGAMAWSTNKALDLEARQNEAEAEAQLRERIRLSLAAMDTTAAGLLVLENQRPPHFFESFFEPEDVFTSEFQVVGKGVVVQPSPLLGTLPDFVRLHFEISNTRQVESPQVPTGNERDLAEQSGISGEFIDAAAHELVNLQALLAEAPSGEAGVPTNLDFLCVACATPEANSWAMPSAELAQQSEAQVNNARLVNPTQFRRSKAYQDDMSLVEKSKRAEVYDNSLQQAVKGQRAQVFGQEDEADAPQAQVPQGADAAATAGAALPAALEDMNPEATPFRPVWMNGELFAIRLITTNGAKRYQGVWLKADELSAHLCKLVETRLAHARLDPIPEVSVASLSGAFQLDLDKLSSDPLALVTLPWRLDPGESAAVGQAGWSPMRMSLTMGWAALLLALVAAAILVRGVMKLSERRATFVSSVTHELRTPLTTFHLYSDMLAEGMVKDEAKKQSYLDTMRREATRLNHLIENVLSYSRIERGSARTQHETISLGALVDRLRPRLEERAKKDAATLAVNVDAACAASQVDTDLTAVEQIVFNLVDNACKYGLPDEGERVVRLNAMNGGRTARIEVCDRGGGIARSDVKKLFRPFHKSAKDAAHSKPGVGLGLALCRRLAGALGGKLRIDCERDEGACFVLELPVTAPGRAVAQAGSGERKTGE